MNQTEAEDFEELDLEYFMAVEDDGSVSNYETIASFHVEETGEDFIIFVDGDAPEGAEVEVMAALFDPAEVVQGNAGVPLVSLTPLETEEHHEIVGAVLQDIFGEDE